MALMETPPAELGWQAVDFNLPGVDGKNYSLANARGENGLLVMFICNHCPYVQRTLDKIIETAAELKKHDIGTIGISANDVVAYPEDNFENMKKLAAAKKFPFPYVIDETQVTAKTYDAVCTPDFFGFDKNMKLQYRGRVDELLAAMIEVAKTGKVSAKQYNSMGCNIKWAA